LIKTVRQDKNVGSYENFMAAYKMVSGDWVSAIDGDDCWLPEKLEKEWKTLQQSPSAKSAEDKSVFVMPNTEKLRLDSRAFIKMTRL
jgi:glycosyltransferase involved in cell wall biosynthesis